MTKGVKQIFLATFSLVLSMWAVSWFNHMIGFKTNTDEWWVLPLTITEVIFVASCWVACMFAPFKEDSAND